MKIKSQLFWLLTSHGNKPGMVPITVSRPLLASGLSAWTWTTAWTRTSGCSSTPKTLLMNCSGLYLNFNWQSWRGKRWADTGQQSSLNCNNLLAGAHLGPHPTWPRGLRAGVERQLQRHRRPLLAHHRRPVLRPHSPWRVPALLFKGEEQKRGHRDAGCTQLHINCTSKHTCIWYHLKMLK